MKDRLLKVFILEDQPMEAELTKRAVLQFAPNAMFTMAATEEEFLQKIQWGEHDVLLADYNLPGYNGLQALLHVREHFPYLPFIFVTGTLNSEQKAAEAILQGANGYVLKDHLEALERSVVNALAKADERRSLNQEKIRRQQYRKLMLQKATTILQATADFPEKTMLEQTLREVMSEI
ncbi:response regulator [Neolewinella lacunae]|uniref:Response regulator n=1 Tax=Neolewinella lacunae TaxID=1517758 RepID=A0A923PK34_9BACT|nr:response regulator [Neolewinella lacunae]MBC6992658.1 response regulator [Neolewinella lacunae]MDN3633538.1 response regulator [Neolewinella lacunae]